MNPDISNVSDIKLLVEAFYEKIKRDPVIGFFFSEVMEVNWDEHLVRMCDFWENVLFYTGTYEGDPIQAHRQINKMHQTEPVHFDRWLLLFNETADSLFAGPNIEKMKSHSRAIAAVMQEKI